MSDRMKNWETTNKLREFIGLDCIGSLAFLSYVIKTNALGNDFNDIEAVWFKDDSYEVGLQLLEIEAGRLSLNSNNKIKNLGISIKQELEVLNFFFNRKIKESSVKAVISFVQDNELNVLKDVALEMMEAEFHKGYGMGTSQSVINLSKAILNIKESDTLADFCCGEGYFLTSILETKNLYGLEMNYNALNKAVKRSILLGSPIEFTNCDILKEKTAKFDKIFCEFPWGLIYDRSTSALGTEKWEPLSVGECKKSNVSWLFIAKVLSGLNDDGIAVINTNLSPLHSTYEMEIRKQLIEKGLLKGVILLPQKINDFASIPSALLILSKNNNEVRFVDATSFGHSKRNVVFTGEDIREIVDIFNSNNDSDKARLVNNEEILLNSNCSLNVTHYLNPITKPIEFKASKKMKDALSEVIRSSIANSDMLTNDSKSGIRVLQSSDIQNGMVDISTLKFLEISELENIKNIDKILLKNNDVVMTNKSTTIKSALLKINDEKVILFGSLYGLRTNNSILNPYYLSAFINSNIGQSLLKLIQTGTVISMITLQNLMNFEIPCPSIEKQQMFVESYKMTLDLIVSEEYKLNKLKEELKNSFESEIAE